VNFRLLLQIAMQLLKARRKQSLVAAAGVTFGIMMFIALVSFMNGLNQMLDGLILNRTPHVRLYNEIKPSEIQPAEQWPAFANQQHFVRSIKPKNTFKSIRNNEAITASLRKDPRVLDVSPKISAPVFYQTGNIEITGAVNGVEIEKEEKLFFFSEYVVEGDWHTLQNEKNTIFIGKGIADKLMVGVGDMIQLSSARGETVLLKVTGILQFGLIDIDNTQSYTSLTTAQLLLGEATNYVTDLQIKLHDLNMAPAVAREMAQVYHTDSIDIQTANSQFETGSKVRTIISFAVGITLLIVAGFGIYNILNMMIYEKMDSIAILKATGFSGTDVRAIFLFISMIIGIIGGSAGLILGYILTVVIDNIPFETAALPTIKTFPIYYHYVYYIIGSIFSLVTTFIAGYFPARKASQIDPVIIIRGK